MPENKYGLRNDGTEKSTGYFGSLKTTDGTDRDMTEFSVGVDFGSGEMEIPTLVPSLTKSELDYLLAGNDPTDGIVDKAVEHAKIRINNKKSPFWGDGDEVSKLPEGKINVRVKGVANPMQFPDDMDITDIREFLRRRFMSQMGESQPDLAPIESVAQEVKPSLAERAGQGISNALYDSGIISDRYGAQRIGSNLSSIGEFLPVIGDATAGDEFGRAAAQGDKAGMLLAGLGAIPLVGDAAKKGYRGISSANKRIDPNITWFSADEKLAKGYSDTNKAFSADLNIKRPFDAGDDKNTTTPLRFANQALSQMGADNIDKKTAMLIKADFLSNYPDPRKEVRVIDFWASDDGKDNVANLLQDLGFDAVRLKEEGVETYGMIRMKAE